MARRVLKRGLAGTIFLMIGIFLFEFVQPLVADSMGGGAGLADMMERLPPAFQSVIQARPEFIAVSGLAGYLSIGFTHPLFYVMVSAAIVALIGRSIAGEIESGALELAIARPISRTSVYVSRLLAVIITIALLIAAAIGGLVSGVLLGNPEGDLIWSHLVKVAAVTALLMGAIAGVTLASTAASNTTSQAVGRATGFIVVSFLINYLASIWNIIEPFDPISIFSWYQPATAFVNGSIDPVDALVLGLTAIIGAVAGGIVFVRRDLPA
jgi:ABC-2 type transport system permease protein